MIRRLYIVSLVGVAAVIPLATAQAQSSFDALSPGNQKIARALFDAQAPTQSGPAPLDLNQIADLKGKMGWGRVFQEMKEDHLVDAKNLGQVVSGYEHTLTHSAALGAGNSGGTLAATTGAGHATEGGHANDVDAAAHGDTGFAHHEDTAITTAGGTSVASAGAVGGGGHGLGIVGGSGGSGSHAGVGGGNGGGHGR